MLKIQSIKISGIGPIKNLEIEFDKHFNIICGQNGIGKTTNYSTMKKTSGIDTGRWDLNTLIDDLQNNSTFIITQFHPEDNNNNYRGLYNYSKHIIVFKTHRNIPYSKLSSLSTDQIKDNQIFAHETISGSLANNLKNWFVNRFLFSAQPDSLDENQIKNYELAKECFQILNKEISFKKVIPDSFEILLNTSLGEIYFEYLSSGYKSCLAVLLGIIYEIELRFKNPSIFIKDFEGIVIIDELDLHLHPDWQAKIYEALKIILPKAQIFTSTHSPHIIQVAQPNEIIALVLDEVSDIMLNPIRNEDYGFQGWTVEEILTDVMGMGETRTETYLDAIDGFNIAIDNQEFEKAQKCYDIIDKMLHPENSLRKILKIQLIGLDND
jgi:predicted ATP-binding protein involved in virulence